MIGTKVKLIASGSAGTVRTHSQWLLTDGSPPLFEFITVTPCILIINSVTFCSPISYLDSDTTAISSLNLPLCMRLEEALPCLAVGQTH